MSVPLQLLPPAPAGHVPTASPEDGTHHIAICGLDCAACEIYKATKNNDEELRKELAAKYTRLSGKPIRPSQIECHGCRGTLETHWASDCRMLICAKERGYTYCHQCPDFDTCEHYDWFRGLKVASHNQILRTADLMKTFGVDEWKRRAKVSSLLIEVGVPAESVVPPPMAIERRVAKMNFKGKRLNRLQIQRKARQWQDDFEAKAKREEEERRATARAKSRAESLAAKAVAAAAAGQPLPQPKGRSVRPPSGKARPGSRAAAASAANKRVVRAAAAVAKRQGKGKARPKPTAKAKRPTPKARPKARPVKRPTAKRRR